MTLNTLHNLIVKTKNRFHSSIYINNVESDREKTRSIQFIELVNNVTVKRENFIDRKNIKLNLIGISSFELINASIITLIYRIGPHLST